ncbi:hypothetical protein [Streptomyces iconiensis]|uniref:CBM6 domain-containing protein n=1 Tax=Streptomyces iconiensis TaxID=1384038 RepID=A0ABT7A9X0_9ACTN|nr:hypothetical protein [Streptomyces iconiensis]MDJ1137847.1 hypothetical protein [Streptomyces iconiensis]
MTAENNGNGAAPEGGEDDPFAYLYRQEGGDGAAQAPTQQPGVPRRSYNQVRAVGERQYGYGYPQQRPQQQPPPPPNQQPSAHYAAPETVPGGRAAARQGAGGRDGYGRGGRSRTGLLVGAIAVVAAVVIGIGAAIIFNKDNGANAAEGKDDDTSQQAGDKNGDKGGKDPKPDKDKPAPKTPPKEDAASLTLGGGATASKDVPNAKGRGGAYVGGLNQPGASATWELKDVPQGGKYTLHVRYGVPGEDADATLTVNGEAQDRPLRMKNWAGAKKGDWAKGWATTWSNIQLTKGENSIKISCEDGNQCNANLDQVRLERGWK